MTDATQHAQIKTRTKGFTLVELIVALGLFSVVSTIAIGSLLALIDNNRQLRGDQALITNVGFVLDMMSRDIRTGINYYCDTVPPGQQGNSAFLPSSNGDLVRDCSAPSGADAQPNHWQGLSFSSTESLVAGTDDRIVYYYDRGANMLFRRVNDDAPQALVSDQIEIVDAYFYVTDTDQFSAVDDTPDNSNRQPTVSIFLAVQANDGQEYQLQTTVTQRLLDI